MNKGIKGVITIGVGLLVALLSICVSAQSKKTGITGMWYAEEMEQSLIEVRQLPNGSYEGIIRSSGKESFVGHKVIYGFKYDEGEETYKGTISSASRNITLDGTIALEGEDKLKITGKKYLMSRTFYWERKD